MWSIIFFLLSTILLINCKQNINKENKISVTQNKKYFTNLRYLDTYETVYVLKNESIKSIKLLGIESSCGCISSKLEDSIIHSNDSLIILVKYRPQISNDSGKVVKHITVRSNSETPFTNLTIEGNVIK